MAVALFEVAEHGDVPNIGSIPLLSRNKTLQNTESLEKLTTEFARTLICTKSPLRTPSPLANTTVVVFGSPAFCISPTCGLQTATLSELKAEHAGGANFIHVAIYDNPVEIQGNLNKATLSQPVQDWGISDLPD